MSIDDRQALGPMDIGRKSDWVVLLAALVLLTAAYALVSVPRGDVVRYVAVYGISFGLFLLAVWRSRAALAALDRGDLVRVLLLTAACLRVAAALAPTSLSDDVFRYVWDGRLLAHEGINPYAELPGALFNRGEISWPLIAQLNSAKFYSVYPPVAQAFFAGVTWVADGLGLAADRALRLGFGVVDVLTVWVLIRLLIRLEMRPSLAVLYAWNPLVYWEVAGGGHTEALMMPLLGLGLWASLGGRWVAVGVFLGLAALCKTTVLVAAPVLVWHLLRTVGVGRATGAALLCLASLTVGYAPFWFDGLLANLRASWSLYYGYFVFNSPLYALARWAFGYEEGVTADVADRVMPWFAAGVVLVAVLAALIAHGRRRRLSAAVLTTLLAHVLLSPVLHPWYLLPVLFLAVPARAWSPQLLAAMIGLSYLSYVPSLAGSTRLLLGLQFAPFAAVLLVDVGRTRLGPILRRRGRRKFGAFADWVAPRSRILDIGAGEGFVSEEASRNGHAPVLVDVAPPGREVSGLPYHVYDGITLPFESKSFDVGVLAYVLHHCRRPDVVLTEASRVCRRLVVMESVFETALDLRLLTFLDHLANWFRGIPVEPLRFDRVEGWRERFAQAGLELVEERWLGRIVHKHVLFVLDCPVDSTG